MSKKVKIAYDYFNGKYPIINNLSTMDIAYEHYGYNPRRMWEICNPIQTMRVLDNHLFEFIPSFILKDNDVFLYEITLRAEMSGDRNRYGLDLLEYMLGNIDLPEKIEHNIKYNNGYLLIEYMTESYLGDMELDMFHSYFTKYGIPLNKIIYYTGSINGSDAYRKYCNKKNIAERMNVIAFEWFEWLSSIQLQELQGLLPKEKDFNKVEKSFLCYNNKYRHWRADLYTIFYKHDLLKDSYFSMFETCDHWGDDWKSFYHSEKHATSYRDDIKNELNITDKDIEYLNSILPLVIDKTVNEWDRIKLIAPEPNLFYQSLVSVVTETNFVSMDVFFTEKTWKPIANCHPFILIGPYKSLEYLKSLGYKTFSDFFDESYDDEAEHGQRLLKIGKLCKEINEWSTQKKKDFFYGVNDITTHNFNLLKSIYPNNRRLKFWDKFMIETGLI